MFSVRAEGEREQLLGAGVQRSRDWLELRRAEGGLRDDVDQILIRGLATVVRLFASVLSSV